MREILFRGKRVDNGEWVYGYFFTEAGVFIKERPSSISTQLYLVIPETVGQYTGANDKTGKKIFEGDINRSGDVVHRGEIQIKGEVFTIEFVQGAFVAVDKTRHGMYLTKKVAGKTEVIGNIHDNPELLEVEE